MINGNEIKKEFEIFDNSNVIYLDSSSTTQMPKSVIKSVNEYYTKYCANASRGSYKWANIVNKKVYEVRKQVASFINANSSSEIIFTSGATHSSNMIAYSWGLYNLKDGDEILICFSDHKSTLLPWLNIQNILKRMNINIKLVPILIDVEGDYIEEDLFSKITSKTRLVVLTHIHNVYGIEMDIEKISNKVKSIRNDILISLDASQSVGHIKVDVQKLKVDFLFFSGHKMFADTGIGILWVKDNVIKTLKPFMPGGGYELDSLDEIVNYNNMYEYLESGSQNISGIISLGSAIEFINKINIENIEEYILQLTRYAFKKLKDIKGIEFLKGIAKCKCAIGYGIISFKIQGYSIADIEDTLITNNIYIRAGNHCTTKNIDDSIRISLHIYNTAEDIDILVNVLKNIVNGI